MRFIRARERTVRMRSNSHHAIPPLLGGVWQKEKKARKEIRKKNRKKKSKKSLNYLEVSKKSCTFALDFKTKAKMLFHEIIVGPIRSRRLGRSLGVNLLHQEAKICTFDCIYCECGLNFRAESHQPTRKEVYEALESKLRLMSEAKEGLDVITFAGNGEPTTHPHFAEIVEDCRILRNKYMPNARLSVLSNATMLWKKEVVEALQRVDNNILKLDSAFDETVRLINQPQQREYSVARVVEGMKQFQGECVVQTMFLRGEVNGVKIDNTTEREVEAWLEVIREVKPRQVQLYSLDRVPPIDTLVKVEGAELEKIAERVKAMGIETIVTY